MDNHARTTGALERALSPHGLGVSGLALRFPVGRILAGVLSVTVHVPGFSGPPGSIGGVALVSKAAGLAGIAVGLPLAASREIRSLSASLA